MPHQPLPAEPFPPHDGWWKTRCKPFDNRRGWCLRRKQWNGRCTRHVNQASSEGEQL